MLGYSCTDLAAGNDHGGSLGVPIKADGTASSNTIVRHRGLGSPELRKAASEGRAVFPRRPAAGSMPAWGWVLIATAATVLPVAGISILVILLMDFFWERYTKGHSAKITA